MKKCGCVVYDQTTHTIKGLHTPVFLDLIQDKVRFRLFTIFLFLFILALAAFEAISVLFYQHSINDNQDPTNLTFKTSPSRTITYGSKMENAPNLRVSNSFEVGLEDKTVKIDIEYNPVIPYEEFIGGKSLIQLRQQEVYGIRLGSSYQSKTNSDGFTSFNEFICISGPEGNAILTYTCDTISQSFNLYIQSEVSRIEVLTVPPVYKAPDYHMEQFGIPFQNQPAFRLYGSDGNPIQGHYLQIYNLDRNLEGFLYYDRMALFEGNIAGPSNESGIIQFTDFTIIGGTTPYNFLALFSEGDPTQPNIFEWTEYDSNGNETKDTTLILPIMLNTTVSKLEIIQEPPENVTEGEPFNYSPIIKVVDEFGKGIPNKIVFAKIRIQGGDTVSDVYEFDYGKNKYLLNPISMKTNENGEAQFEDLRFSIRGIATYYKNESLYYFKLVFICDGIESNLSNKIWIQTKVNKIEWITIPTRIVKPEGWAWADNQNSSAPYGTILEKPMVKLVDSEGNGVPNKAMIGYVMQKENNLTSLFSLYGNLEFSDNDGIVEFSQFRVLGFPSNVTDVVVRLFCDDIDIVTDPIPVELGNNSTQRCSQIYINTSVLPDYFEGQYLVGHTPPFDMWVQVLDYKGTPLANQLVGVGVFIEDMNTHVPIAYWYPSMAENSTDSNGTTYFRNVTLEGYSTTGIYFVYAYNPQMNNHLFDSNIEFDCSETLLVQLNLTIIDVEIINVQNDQYVGIPFSDPFILNVNDYVNGSGHVVDVIPVIVPLYLLNSGVYDFIGPENDTIDPGPQINVPSQWRFYRNPIKTDINGSITLDQLFVNYPGSYRFLFRVDGLITNLSKTIVVNVNVSYIIIVQEAATNNPPTTSPIPFDQQPILQLLDSSMNPVQGLFVIAETQDNLTSNFYTDNIFFDPISSKTNSSGYATFSNLRFEYVTIHQFYNICYSFYFNSTNKIQNCSQSPIEAATNVTIVSATNVPSTAVRGQVFSYLPIVIVTDQDGGYLQGKTVIAAVLEFPSTLLLDPNEYILANFFTQTNELGQAFFKDIMFQNAVSMGFYKIAFFCDNVSSESFSIEVSETAFTLDILIEPAQNITVGIPFPTTDTIITTNDAIIAGKLSVMVFGKSKEALPYKSVNALIYPKTPEEANAILDPTRTIVETDEYGIAIFDLKLTSGKPNYNISLYFRCDQAESDSTTSFILFNPIYQVNIIRQPGLKGDNYVYLGDTIPEQPIIQVLNHTGFGVSNKKVIVKTIQQGSVIYNSDEPIYIGEGKYEFQTLTIEVGSTEDYQLIFMVDGIESYPSNSFAVRDPSTPDFSGFNNLKTLVLLATIIMILPFFANSERQNGSYGLILPIIVSIIMVILMSFTIASTAKGKIKNPYIIISLTVLTIITFGVAGFIWFIMIIHFWGNPKKWEFCPKRISNYQNLLKRLLPIGGTRYFLLQEIKKKIEEEEKQKHQKDMKDVKLDLEFEINLNSNSNQFNSIFYSKFNSI
eukprot:Anaeramoba_ignava/a222069_31.p1 GENE.a222069_31~~a222069_31.p1  ORF type:complete len:1484 (+),score=441.01 a222069_31:51-4502(+)